jgi:rRNA maturation endonuclease Nob1
VSDEKPEQKTVTVLDVQKIRTMSDYDITCKQCEHVYNGRAKIPCPKCGMPSQLQQHPAWTR